MSCSFNLRALAMGSSSHLFLISTHLESFMFCSSSPEAPLPQAGACKTLQNSKTALASLSHKAQGEGGLRFVWWEQWGNICSPWNIWKWGLASVELARGAIPCDSSHYSFLLKKSHILWAPEQYFPDGCARTFPKLYQLKGNLEILVNLKCQDFSISSGYKRAKPTHSSWNLMTPAGPNNHYPFQSMRVLLLNMQISEAGDASLGPMCAPKWSLITRAIVRAKGGWV